MAVKDMENTTFITPWGTYYYTVMPFGLKNVEAPYQRTTTTMLHDLMHKECKEYVDDMILKSKLRDGYVQALQTFFAKLRK